MKKKKTSSKTHLSANQEKSTVWSSKHKGFIEVECDQCGNEFAVRSEDIKWYDLVIGGKSIGLQYFICPECKAVYRIALVDDKARKMADELDHQKARWKKCASQSGPVASRQYSLMLIKAAKLKRYKETLLDKYRGTFTFGVLKDGNIEKEQITYHE